MHLIENAFSIICLYIYLTIYLYNYDYWLIAFQTKHTQRNTTIQKHEVIFKPSLMIIIAAMWLVQEPLSKALNFLEFTCCKSLRADMSFMQNASNIKSTTLQTSS